MVKPEKRPAPSPEWEKEYHELMKDPYLKKKYNRERRIADKKKYIDTDTAEVKAATGKRVLDIGPGPGEWLEWCRAYGHIPYGIDAVVEIGEMGYEYTRLSQMMAERQELDILYNGLMVNIADGFSMFEDKSIYFINSQGALAQCFADHMIGPPHRETKDSGQLSWDINEVLIGLFKMMFDGFNRILEPGGYIFIWINGSKNDHEYDRLLRGTLDKIPSLRLIKKKGNRWHKIQKVTTYEDIVSQR